MATQRLLLMTIGGSFAEMAWTDIRSWSDARTTTVTDKWSADDWSPSVQREIDSFVEKLSASAFVPPILYRSEHVDCWSMGDVFCGAIMSAAAPPDHCRQLYTTNHELIAAWVTSIKQITPASDFASETIWLYNRANEAMAAWGEFSDRRLILLIRTLLGGMWTDKEVAESLKAVPVWWTLAE